MELIKTLLNENCIKFRDDNKKLFLLKSGKKSEIFINIKQACLNPSVLKEIVDNILNLVPIRKYDAIASISIGGVPIGTALSLETDIPQIIIRSDKHISGIESRVIGDCGCKNCILIDDVSTTGSTIVDSVNLIRSLNGTCNDAIIVVDREEGADILCKNNNIFLYSCLKISDIL